MKLKPFSGYKYLRAASASEKLSVEKAVLEGPFKVKVYRGKVVDGLVGLSLCQKHGLDPVILDLTKYINDRWPKAQPFFYKCHHDRIPYTRHCYLAGSLMLDYESDSGMARKDVIDTFRLIGGESQTFYESSYNLCRKYSDHALVLKTLEIKTGPEVASSVLKVARAMDEEEVDDLSSFLVGQVGSLSKGQSRSSMRKQTSLALKSGEQAVGRCVRILGGVRDAAKNMNEEEARKWKELNEHLEAIIRGTQDLRNSLDTFL